MKVFILMEDLSGDYEHLLTTTSISRVKEQLVSEATRYIEADDDARAQATHDVLHALALTGVLDDLDDEREFDVQWESGIGSWDYRLIFSEVVQ